MVGGQTAEWCSRSGASCAARHSAANSKDSNRHSICTRWCGSSARRSMERQLCLDVAGGGAARTSSQHCVGGASWSHDWTEEGGTNTAEWRGMHDSSWRQHELQAAGGWPAAIVAAAAWSQQPSRGQSKAARQTLASAATTHAPLSCSPSLLHARSPGCLLTTRCCCRRCPPLAGDPRPRQHRHRAGQVPEEPAPRGHRECHCVVTACSACCAMCCVTDGLSVAGMLLACAACSTAGLCAGMAAMSGC